MRNFADLWPTLKRLLAYGSPWRKPLIIAVIMMWIAAAAEVSGPLLISYFIDNMVAKQSLPVKLVSGLAAAYIFLQILPLRCTITRRCCLTGRRSAWCSSCAAM